jgi:hypothetical protein
MKKLITIILLAMCITPAFAQKEKNGVTYDVVLTRVIDGDTCLLYTSDAADD